MSLPPTAADVVLIVDDQPDNLALLHDALDEAGYTVLVATDGASALQRARHALPDIVLLDALMPGMDGFAVARALRADPDTAPIPIVFMTALTEAEHVVQAFDAGGTDYVTKPIRPAEVLARIAAHTRAARAQRQARHALDAFGHATAVLRTTDGRVVWQTPLARELMQRWFGEPATHVPEAVAVWLRQATAAPPEGAAPPGTPLQPAEPPQWSTQRGAARLTLALHAATDENEWMVVAREIRDTAAVESLLHGWRLTAREAEVLYWVAQGKTNRDIGEILSLSPRTVTKHLEHVFEKMGVETRTSAAAMALARMGRR